MLGNNYYEYKIGALNWEIIGLSDEQREYIISKTDEQYELMTEDPQQGITHCNFKIGTEPYKADERCIPPMLLEESKYDSDEESEYDSDDEEIESESESDMEIDSEYIYISQLDKANIIRKKHKHNAAYCWKDSKKKLEKVANGIRPMKLKNKNVPNWYLAGHNNCRNWNSSLQIKRKSIYIYFLYD